MNIDTEHAFSIAGDILNQRWPELDDRTVEILATQAACREYESREHLSKKLTRLVDGQFPHLRKRRKNRGKLVSVDGWLVKGKATVSAELNPETTIATDEKITTIALASADSDHSRVILNGHEKAADTLEHVLAAVPPTQRRVLQKVLPHVESNDSLSELAARADLHPTQVSRAFEAAQRGDRVRLFKEARRTGQPPAIIHTTYQPAGVPFDLVMMTHQGAVVPYIGLSQRTSIGVDLVNGSNRALSPLRAAESVESQESTDAAASTTVSLPTHYQASDGCNHQDRQWFRVEYGVLRLTCLACQTELARRYAFALNP